MRAHDGEPCEVAALLQAQDGSAGHHPQVNGPTSTRRAHGCSVQGEGRREMGGSCDGDARSVSVFLALHGEKGCVLDEGGAREGGRGLRRWCEHGWVFLDGQWDGVADTNEVCAIFFWEDTTFKTVAWGREPQPQQELSIRRRTTRGGRDRRGRSSCSRTRRI